MIYTAVVVWTFAAYIICLWIFNLCVFVCLAKFKLYTPRLVKRCQYFPVQLFFLRKVAYFWNRSWITKTMTLDIVIGNYVCLLTLLRTQSPTMQSLYATPYIEPLAAARLLSISRCLLTRCLWKITFNCTGREINRPSFPRTAWRTSIGAVPVCRPAKQVS